MASARRAAVLLAALASAGSAACDSAGVEIEDHVLLLQTDININKNSRGLGTAVRSETLEDAPAEDVAPAVPAGDAAAAQAIERPRRWKERRSPLSLLSRHWQAPQAPYGSQPGAPNQEPHSWTNPFSGLSNAVTWAQSNIGRGRYFSGVASAAVVAALCSGDDLIWLTPFAAHEQRLFLLPFYCICMTLLAALAWLIQFSGFFLDSRHDNMPVELILRLVTTVALFWYSTYLYQEWTKDEWTSGGASSKDVDSGRPSLIRGNLLPPPEDGWNSLGSAPSMSPLPSSPERQRRGLSNMESPEAAVSAEFLQESHRSLPPLPDQAPWAKPAGESVLISLGPVGGIPKESPYWNLFVMSMVGGQYPLVAYVTLLYSHMLSGPKLMAGVALSSVAIASICFGFTYSRTIFALCERVPFWCVVFALGLWSIYGLCQDTFVN